MEPTRSLSSDVRFAWIAGVIEGEGWIGVRFPAAPVLQVAMTDEDVVRRLHEWSAVGTVTGPRVRPDKKPVWIWRVSARDEAGGLLLAVLPFLGRRRAERAEHAIAAWRGTPTRGTAPTCGKGHPLEDANLYEVEGRRRCRTCINARQAAYRERRQKAQESSWAAADSG